MSTDRDDDALSWGDEDPTLDTGRTLPAGYTAVGKGSETVARPAAAGGSGASGPTVAGQSEAGGDAESKVAAADASSGPSNAALVILGVFGGIYALESVGWIIGGLRLRPYAEFLVDPIAYQVSLWLAVLTPLIWFVTVLVLTRGARAWLRVVLLLAGAVLVLPWPFIMVGAIGQ